MSEVKESQTSNSILKENLATLAEPENFQKYILGTKKNGSPRAVYDVIKDYTQPKKKDKKKKKNKTTSYSFYLDNKPKKKKKKKNKNKYWHI